MHQRHILLVDDNRDLAESLAEVLSTADFDVSIALSAEEALEVAKRQHFDLALLDIKLPGISGVELLRTLKQNQPTLHALMMTGAALPKLVSEALGQGATAVLRKPFRIEDLLQRVRALLCCQSVLIADDDSDFLDSISTLLAEAGYRVHVAHDGQEAVSMATEATVDVLLLDLRMPSLRGVEVVRELRERERCPTVIVVTAYAETEAEQLEGLRAMSIERCLAKPFTGESLLDAIRAALAARPAAST